MLPHTRGKKRPYYIFLACSRTRVHKKQKKVAVRIRAKRGRKKRNDTCPEQRAALLFFPKAFSIIALLDA